MNPMQEKTVADTTRLPDHDAAELPDDPRLMEVVQEYLLQLESGNAPSREEFQRRYMDIAEPLAQCLDGLDLIHKVAAKPNLLAAKPKMPTGSAGDGLPANPLGDFQIVREIGRGGMGVVYEAVQLSLGRRVALKVLPLAAAFDATHLQRFRNEAQAAALLHHTNIVPVYAVGCERGVHFYAMQLIDGQTLAAVLDHLRGPQQSDRSQRSASAQDLAGVIEGGSAASPPTVANSTDIASPLSQGLSEHRSKNSTEFYHTIARFMIQAADGLEHAHQYGIVHRDIKPANLLVDGQGRLWITDFGLAQFHSSTGLTKTGDILGTLRYMSPEQAAGRHMFLDHRTDIYSLGATLYQLVTLEPMFPGRNQQELLHQILHEEPQAPRTLEPGVPVELETIILKAVSKNPSDRYSSAKEFATDLQRYLDNKPILAKRPGRVERIRKWSRRHPSIVVAAMLLLTFGVIGFGVSTFIIAGAYEREKQRAEEAEQRFNLAKQSADEMIRIAQDELADYPHTHVRRQLLEAALTYYQKFIEQRSDKPDSQAELAVTRDLVKEILTDLAILQGAGRHQFLIFKSILDDLAASHEQRGRLSDLFRSIERQRQDSFKDFHLLTPEERSNQFLQLARTNEAAINAILKPAQLERLRQIARQHRGPMAFQDAEVVSELKLTREQRKQIRAIARTLAFPGDFPMNKTSLPPWKISEEKRKEAVVRTKDVMDRIKEILTAEQRTRWTEVTGKPFTDWPPGFSPFGGFGFPPQMGVAGPRSK